jgi:ferredoxin--NADP+ reductase
MYKILDCVELAQNTKQIEVKAPLVARKAEPGQFVIVIVDEHGERIPLTIADYDRRKGTVTIVFLEIGKTTLKLGKLKTGDYIQSFIGPLGNPSDIKREGTIVFVGGGVELLQYSQ